LGLAACGNPGRPRSVGFTQFTVADSGTAIAAAAWYPSSSEPVDTTLGLFRQTVALEGRMAPGRFPLVIFSHGTGGWLGSSYDTARRLAEAGFIAVALTHPHDNSADRSAAGSRRNLIDRPRHLSVVLDYVLKRWAARNSVDSQRIGAFGHSLGAYTVLVAAGAMPDLATISAMCRTNVSAPECAFIRQNHGDQLHYAVVPPGTWRADRRIRAIVVAAPALGFVFGVSGLQGVRVPVQLWAAEDDSQAPNAWNSDLIERRLPSKPEVHKPPRSGHFSFLAPCTRALARAVPLICTDPAGLDRAAFHEELDADVVRFFQEHLH
jgi:predicted dienelactone hydrolase